MQHRLRYLAHDFELPPGEFFIGRSDECQLMLDDPLVSRKHAVLRVTQRGVLVADLGSRNGVLVNGQRVTAERYLAAGDVVQIGSQELSFDQYEDGVPSRAMNQTLGDISAHDIRERLRELTGQRPDGDEATQIRRDPPIRPRPPVVSSAAATVPTGNGNTDPPIVWGAQPAAPAAPAPGVPAPQASAPGAPAPPAPAGPTAAGKAPSVAPSAIEGRFNALSGVADKGLAMKRADDVERILAPLFTQFLAELRAGKPQPPNLLAELSAYALKLAHLNGEAQWVEYVFDAHSAAKRLMPAATVDELHTLLRKVRGFNVRLIRDYLQVVRARGATMSPNERFIVMRIEGLEAVASSG